MKTYKKTMYLTRDKNGGGLYSLSYKLPTFKYDLYWDSDIKDAFFSNLCPETIKKTLSLTKHLKKGKKGIQKGILTVTWKPIKEKP